MALSQEFWLQRRRREAESAVSTARSQESVLTGSAVPTPLLQVGTMAPANLVNRGGVVGAGGVLMTPSAFGMAWAGSPLRASDAELQGSQEKRQWNSDDEEIDDYGRRKRKAKAIRCLPDATTVGGSSASNAIASSSDSPHAVLNDWEAGEASSSAADTERKKASKSELSEKQRAALERLQKRRKPAEAEPEAMPTPSGCVGTSVCSLLGVPGGEASFMAMPQASLHQPAFPNIDANAMAQMFAMAQAQHRAALQSQAWQSHEAVPSQSLPSLRAEFAPSLGGVSLLAEAPPTMMMFDYQAELSQVMSQLPEGTASEQL